MKCNQTERNNDKQNRLFMDVPAEKEGGIATERKCTNEGFPSWLV